MDPLSHAAFGRTLVALDGRHRLGAGATTAAVLGALCPDLDLARAFQGWDVYLLQHQSGTHCLIGALGCGILTGSKDQRIKGSKDQEITGSKDRTIASWLRLVGAGTLGALSHVALDLVSGADLRLFVPVSDCIFTLPLFAMADPWLLAVLIVSAVIASFAGRRGALAGLLGVALMLAIKGAFYVRANEIERGAAEPAPPMLRRCSGHGLAGPKSKSTRTHSNDGMSTRQAGERRRRP